MNTKALIRIGISQVIGLVISAAMIAAAIAADEGVYRQYQLERKADGSGYGLALKTLPAPRPQAGEVLIRVKAASLNRRDVYALSGIGMGGARDMTGSPILSDGAGEVAAVGPGVTRFKPGDRVVATFDVKWVDGASQGYQPRNGMLAELAVATEDTVLPIPEYLSYDEAATLPCAAVTAWNALFKAAALKPDDYVLMLGTGGVSIFGLQLAVAGGGRAIITSSSDAKLARSKELGAFGAVNYRTYPDWENEVLAITGRKGVTNVLEVGGQDTLPHSIASLADGGHIGLIGGLSEGGFVRETPEDLLKEHNARLTNVYVGSSEDFANLLAFMVQHQIKPVIDKVFEFEDAPAAFEYMEGPEMFGKIVVRIP